MALHLKSLASSSFSGLGFEVLTALVDCCSKAGCWQLASNQVVHMQAASVASHLALTACARACGKGIKEWLQAVAYLQQFQNWNLEPVTWRTG